MKIATWNVNSIRTRVDRVVAWLDRTGADVLTIQETKCKPEQFPRAPFEERGLHVEVLGLNQWNGVAIVSRQPLTEVQHYFTDVPIFGDSEVAEPRALAATTGGIRVYSLYVPHGRSLDNEHYRYKLAWLEALAREAAGIVDRQVALTGDWNIAPFDSDVWDIALFEGATHVSEAERAAFNRFIDLGYRDVVRDLVPEGYTYWDYQQLRFPRNEGMRIDFILASPTLAARVTDAFIDRDERKGKGASDHVPVMVTVA